MSERTMIDIVLLLQVLYPRGNSAWVYPRGKSAWTGVARTATMAGLNVQKLTVCNVMCNQRARASAIRVVPICT